jgi:hypothetical protein
MAFSPSSTDIITQEAAMLSGFNLNDLFIFPFKDQEARKNFFVGCLLYLACFVIPIIPWLIAAGYNAILVRQVLNGEKPHLVKWENWETLFRDGARLVGIRLIYSSPLLVLFAAIFILSFAFPLFPILIQNSDNQSIGGMYLLWVLLLTAIFLFIMPLSMAVGLIVPAAEIYMVEKDDFTAGLKVKEWWPIFKKNWGGFVVALAILYGLTMVMSFAMQIIFMTLFLICLLPILMPAISMYSAVIQYVAYAKAYKDGQEKLAMDSIVV